MADIILSPNMALPVPVTGVDAGPDYANNINSSLNILDAHTHAAGSGVQITPTGLNINTDLPFNNSNLITARSVRFQSQSAALGLVTDIGCLYEVLNDLYFNDGSGNQIRITQSGAVAGTPGSIANLVAPASASYVSVSQTFVWQSAANTPANLDAGFIVLRNNSASSNGLTLMPPAAMGSNYTITLPALPASTKIMSIDSSGNVGAVYGVDNSTLEIVSNTLQVKDLGITAAKIANSTITAAQIANSTITGTQVSSSIDLPGKAVKEDGLNVVVSNTNASTNSLAIVRGSAGSGGGSAGEGFTSINTGTGAYTVVFTTAFLDTPAVTANLNANAGYVYFASISNTGFSLVTNNPGGSPTTLSYNFIAIGQRAT